NSLYHYIPKLSVPTIRFISKEEANINVVFYMLIFYMYKNLQYLQSILNKGLFTNSFIFYMLFTRKMNSSVVN
ncbi:hypothetical protein EAY42_18940, partial [Vibrio anguillarum]|nr:hypothetical protein [Vibrio anguillarum]